MNSSTVIVEATNPTKSSNELNAATTTVTTLNQCGVVTPGKGAISGGGQTAKVYKRSEQTRRFAEARREFEMRLRDGKFDKKKLTMFDLIFYNPTTNLMR